MNYSKLIVAQGEIRNTIYSHSEFTTFSQGVVETFARWKKSNLPKMKAIAVGNKPKKLIADFSEDLLSTFTGVGLIDRYDMYQHLLTYWAETMQDDVYALVDDDWEAGREIETSKGKKGDWEGRIIPKQLIIGRYFDAEQKAIEQLEADRDDMTRQMEEMAEDHGGEEGLLNEVIDARGKITKAAVQKQIKDISDDDEPADELAVLQQYLKLIDGEAAIAKKLRDAWSALEKKLLEKYAALGMDEIKTLVGEDKWLAELERDVQSEIQRVSQRLTGRINELAERYETTLPLLNAQVTDLESKVNAHLEKMGFTYQ